MFFLLSLFFFFFLFFLVWEERIHAGGDFGAKYWRDRIIYQAQQEDKKKKTEESPGSEPRRDQFLRNTKSVGLKQRGHGAEGRRAETVSWFGSLVQPI